MHDLVFHPGQTQQSKLVHTTETTAVYSPLPICQKLVSFKEVISLRISLTYIPQTPADKPLSHIICTASLATQMSEKMFLESNQNTSQVALEKGSLHVHFLIN